MKIENVMSRDVVTVDVSTPLRDVAQLLAEKRISGVPVVSDEAVVGIVSEADILAKERGESHERHGLFGFLLDDRAAAELKLEARTAGEAMSAPPITIAPDRPLAEAAATMIDEGVNRLPVVDDAGQLLGIVTRADLVKAFVRSDTELAEEIREDVLLRALWIPPESVTVNVEDGMVTLRGHVENRTTAELLPEFVQRVPGVVSVVAEVTWDDNNGHRHG
jgi:CBS domain-containing protein